MPMLSNMVVIVVVIAAVIIIVVVGITLFVVVVFVVVVIVEGAVVVFPGFVPVLMLFSVRFGVISQFAVARGSHLSPHVNHLGLLFFLRHFSPGFCFGGGWGWGWGWGWG